MQRDNLKNVPNKSGVYFFRDKRGRILYIGKAVNLKNRLTSYFKPQLGGRTAKLLQVAAKVNWKETDSEIEALILESRLIKKHKPSFNIMLRDDKQYFYVGFTDDKFPKLLITHQPKTVSRKLKAVIAGPFTDGSALKTTLRLLRRIFPYCTCKQKHNNFCLNYHIGKCLGFCCLKNKILVSKYDRDNIRVFKNNSRAYQIYQKNIKAIKEILKGKRVSLIKKLKKEMVDLGKAGKFEEAIGLRDKIVKLEKVFENAQIIRNANLQMRANATNQKQKTIEELKRTLKLSYLPHRIEGYDVSNIQGQFATGAMVVFTDGQPDKKEYRKFKIRSDDRIFRHRKTSGLAMTLNQKPNDVAMLKEVLTRRFNHPEWLCPDLIIVDGGKAQLNIVAKVISGHRKTSGLAMTPNSIPIIALTKDKRHQGSHIYLWSSQDPRLKEGVMPLKKLPERVKNLILQVDAEAHRFAIGYYRKLHGKLGY